MWLKNLNTVSVLNSLSHQNTNIGKPSSKFVAGPHSSLPWKKVNEAIRTFYVPQHCSCPRPAIHEHQAIWNSCETKSHFDFGFEGSDNAVYFKKEKAVSHPL